MSNIIVQIANESHYKFAEAITYEMEQSAKARGTGIAKRSPEYIKKQMAAGKAIIALDKTKNAVCGFCYIESWQGKRYAANSGLIVFPEYRNHGLANRIKEKAFFLSRKMYPQAKLFGLTTSLAVMKINSELGYVPTVFSELTEDDEFWKGCQTCVNYNILQSKERKNCLCTGMIFDPNKKKKSKWNFIKNLAIVKRLKRVKQSLFLKFQIAN